MVTLQEIKQNESIRALIKAGNRYLESMGYTEHGPRHVGYVSKTASYILKALGYSPREVELAAIAGWVHDVGNSVNRHDHGPLGAVLLLPILREMGMDMADIMEIITAVGNHEEQSGFISSAVSATLSGSVSGRGQSTLTRALAPKGRSTAATVAPSSVSPSRNRTCTISTPTKPSLFSVAVTARLPPATRVSLS